MDKIKQLTDKQVKDYIRTLDISNTEKHRLYNNYLREKKRLKNET